MPAAGVGCEVTGVGAELTGTAPDSAGLDGVALVGAGLDGIAIPSIDSCGSAGRVSAAKRAELVVSLGPTKPVPEPAVLEQAVLDQAVLEQAVLEQAVLEQAVRTDSPRRNPDQPRRCRLIGLPSRRGMTATRQCRG
jgi:uncharacterized protein YjbI with pentapeptide repeats